MSEELERIGLEAVFETADFKKNASSYADTLQQANKATAKAAGDMAKSMSNISNEIDLAGKGWQGAVGDMLKAGASVKDIARFFGMSEQEVRAYAMASQEATTNSIQAAMAADQQAQATERAGAAARTTTSYLNRYLTRLALWVTVGAAVRGVIRAIITNLKEGFKALYENTDEYKNLTTASERFRNSLVVSFFPLEKTLDLMEKLAIQANLFADAMEREAARRVAGAPGGSLQQIREIMDKEAGAFGIQDRFERKDVQTVRRMFLQPGVLTDEQIKQLDEISKKYNLGIDVLGEYSDALGKIHDATIPVIDEEEKLADTVADLAKILQAADEELARHAQAVSEIHMVYDEAAVEAMTTYYQKLQSIAKESNADIVKINQDAAAKIEKIIASTNARIAQLQARAAAQAKYDAQRHQLEMEFMRKRFELTQIQNERMYQAARRRLVGYGDVLAIEELDEQYELQKQAAEENYQLQKEQAEEIAKLQAKIQAEAIAAQIEALQQAMQDQITAIAEAKNEQVKEAEEAAADEEEIAKKKRDQMLQDAKETRDQELADEAEAHKKRMEAIAQQVKEFVDKYDIELSALENLIEDKWGPNSAMDNAVKDYFTRIKGYADDAASYISNLMSGYYSYQSGGGYYYQQYQSGGGYYYQQYQSGQGQQAGTTGGKAQVYSQPTTIPVAEGRAEAVTVEPLYPTGNATMSVSWSGDAIPVVGQGSLAGADLDALGSSITVAMVSKLQQAYQNKMTSAG